MFKSATIHEQKQQAIAASLPLIEIAGKEEFQSKPKVDF